MLFPTQLVVWSASRLVDCSYRVVFKILLLFYLFIRLVFNKWAICDSLWPILAARKWSVYKFIYLGISFLSFRFIFSILSFESLVYLYTTKAYLCYIFISLLGSLAANELISSIDDFLLLPYASLPVKFIILVFLRMKFHLYLRLALSKMDLVEYISLIA